MQNILVIDDDESLRDTIGLMLENEGFHPILVADGTTGLEQAVSLRPHLILVDLRMPGLSGVEVCRILRARPATAHLPIIMLTARSTEADRVTGLDVGADDYISKPFGLRELSARVRAVLRRGGSEQPQRVKEPLIYRGKHLTADFDAVSVVVNGAAVRLTRREFELLRYLVENKNRVISRDRLLEQVWGYDRFVETRSVDVHVGRLRGKLGDASGQIETVVGLVYRFGV